MRTTSARCSQPATRAQDDVLTRLGRMTLAERMELCARDPRTYAGLAHATAEATRAMARIGWLGISVLYATTDLDELGRQVFATVVEAALRAGIERTTADLAEGARP